MGYIYEGPLLRYIISFSKMAEGLNLQKLMKTTPSKALVIRINLVFLAFFLVFYASLLLSPSSSVYFENAASLVKCSLRECHHKVRQKMGVG